MTSVAVMGSSGSIGTQTLEIVRAAPDDYDVVALSVRSSLDVVVEQAQEFRPSKVVVDPEVAVEARSRLDSSVEVLAGSEGLREASASPDVVINGVVGFAGLAVTLSTLEHGHRLGLANKESLIAAGPVVQQAWKTPGAELLPVDSEHCALHQCLRATTDGRGVSTLVLTASGGPFRGRTADQLAGVTVDDALAHPTWSMGPKITVDSSTLMNKGLEVIEAHELFGVSYDDIEVVVHPQSIVHSMVAYSDGSTIAQLSEPDMRLCIGYALAYPDRLDIDFGAIDWSKSSTLTFEPPDRHGFRCLDLAFDAGRRGGTAPAWLSAANEVVVESFLAGLIPWTGIADVNEELLEKHDGRPADSLDAVLSADTEARALAYERIHGSL
ncbi:MAG: 1-deoxy-D-xylulose-5-phosphate reductoisomerase [Acidimicrobiales bacterium]